MSAAQTMTALAQSARETETEERERFEREPSFVTAMSPSSVVSASAIPDDLSSSPMVEGRVFRRLMRFQLLPSELKAQSDMVATYLLAPKVRSCVFEQRKHWWQHPLHLAKAGLGTFVQGRKLLKSILEYLVLSHAANNSLRDAQNLAEGLVLSGFLSPVNEASEADDEPIGEIYIVGDTYYELVAPGANAVVPTSNVIASATVGSSSTSSLPGAVVLPMKRQGSPTGQPKQSQHSGNAISVWAVTDGATRAGFVLRHFGRSYMRNLLGLASKAPRCYAVVNKTKHHSLILFETDVARRELVRVKLSSATVEYYSPSGDDKQVYGLKICGDDTDGRRDGSSESHDLVEILLLRNKSEQEQWLLALLDAGAAFLETHPGILSCAVSSASLYSMRDTDASGKTFCMSSLRGHVALLTNVAGGSCDDNNEQLTELADLSAKYKDEGLRVVAFPSVQFSSAAFTNDKELAAHLQQSFGVDFPVLATQDVNGPNSRDALLFCKTRLRGAAASAANAFIEDNCVKFLIDRDGQPVKRYSADIMPHSLEKDIQRLLNAGQAPTP